MKPKPPKKKDSLPEAKGGRVVECQKRETHVLWTRSFIDKDGIWWFETAIG